MKYFYGVSITIKALRTFPIIIMKKENSKGKIEVKRTKNQNKSNENEIKKINCEQLIYGF